MREFELKIERAELEVGGSNTGDNGSDHGAAAPLGGEKGSARGFGGAAILSPEIELPRGGKGHLPGGLLDSWKGDGFGGALCGEIRTAANAGKLIGTGDAQLRLGL